MAGRRVVQAFKAVGLALALAVLLAALAWLFRSDPIMMISGRTLVGEEFPYPDDWGFTDSQNTIAVETRPEDPHSVTTICFVHGGELYVPAQSGSSKRWPSYVVEDPRVRLKIDGRIYRARAVRVLPVELTLYRDSIARKYSAMANRSPDEFPPDVWLFRIAPRES